jgi:mRNA interferase RelE/StbE
LDKYQIAETDTFTKKIKSRKYNHQCNKILKDVYPILKIKPFFGINIRKLKGAYKEIYRFRIRDYRIFYKKDKKKAIIYIIDIENRQDAYK